MALSRINNPFLSSSGADNTSITSPAANTIAFSTATTERMRILSDGNTFIGRTSATWDERVGIRTVTGTGQVGLGVYSPSTTYASSLIRVQSENATGTAYNLFEGRGQGGGVKILIDGNGLVDLKNGQIKFPAAQNASSDLNTLDDYERGTWTPSLKFGGNSVGMTYTTQQGYYVKIGSFVMTTCLITLSAKGSSTGSATITGLPFSIPYYGSGNAAQIVNISFTGMIDLYVNGTTVTIQQTSAAGSLAAMSNANFASNSQMIFTTLAMTTTP